MSDDVLAPLDGATVPGDPARPVSELRTFLIADVRGYTSFTQRFGDERAAALTQRFGAVTRAIVEHDGKVVELRGDEALCAFSSPRQALRAAAALQRRFVAETRQDPELPLPVGIGIDVGEAVAVDDGYRGGALNLAARLCSIAGPGEILATTEVVHLARRLDGLSYVPRDAVRFKGIDDPVRPVQVVPEGEDPARQFAALDAPPTVPRPPKGPRWLPSPVRRRPLVSAGVALAALVAAATVVVVAADRQEVTSFGEDVAGVLDPATGALVAQVPVGTSPTSVAVGSGAVWAVGTDDDTVARIDPATRSVTQVIGVGGAPTAAVVGGGSLWVTDSSSGTVSRIDPANGRVQQTLPVGASPSAAVFARGALWVADTAAAAVLRVDPATGAVTARVGVGDAPSAVVAGNDSLWVSNSGDATVSQIDLSHPTALPPVHVGNDPRGLVLDGDTLWVANNLDGTVTRLDTATGTVAATIPVGKGPVAVAVAAGKVWVADQEAAAITAVDPVRNTATATVPTTSQPAGIVAAGSQLWVAVGAEPALHRGGTFTAAITGVGVDPAHPDSLELGMLYDGLVTFRQAPGAAGDVVVPDLAAALPVPGDGGLSYTFRLRRGIRWSTGAAVTGGEIRRGIERTVASGAVPDLAIVGADGCTPAACDLSAGVTVDEAAGTVAIRLSKPDPEFLDDLAGAVAVPVSTPIGPVDGSLPTTGPYRVGRFDRDTSLVLVRNPYFHEWSHAAQPAGFPDRLVFTVDHSPAEHPGGVPSSTYDWMDVRGADLDALRSRVGDRLRISPRLAERYVFLNTSVAPFDVPDARRAVSYAIDRDAVAAASPEPGTVTCQALPPTVPGHRPYCPYTLRPDASGAWHAPDLATAQRLVQQSGTAGTAVTVWTTAFLAPAMQPVVDAMNEIGYRATLTTVSNPGDYYDELGRRPDAQAGSLGWIGAYPSASQFTTFDECAAIGTGQNYARFCDPSIDAGVDAALALEARSPQQANDTWAAVDRALTNAVPLVPLLVATNAVLLSPRVRHYEVDVTGPLYDQVWVK